MTTRQREGDQLAESGVLSGVELDSRKRIFVRENKIAAVVELKPDGPTRLMLIGGGHIDVCGDAAMWWRILRLTELKIGQ